MTNNSDLIVNNTFKPDELSTILKLNAQVQASKDEQHTGDFTFSSKLADG